MGLGLGGGGWAWHRLPLTPRLWGPPLQTTPRAVHSSSTPLDRLIPLVTAK